MVTLLSSGTAPGPNYILPSHFDFGIVYFFSRASVHKNENQLFNLLNLSADFDGT
jgi:hypothetical protein